MDGFFSRADSRRGAAKIAISRSDDQILFLAAGARRAIAEMI
jgi:hypothetical protein